MHLLGHLPSLRLRRLSAQQNNTLSIVPWFVPTHIFSNQILTNLSYQSNAVPGVLEVYGQADQWSLCAFTSVVPPPTTWEIVYKRSNIQPAGETCKPVALVMQPLGIIDPPPPATAWGLIKPHIWLIQCLDGHTYRSVVWNATYLPLFILS